MSSNHDQTANAIAAKKGVPYNQGKGPDIKGPRQIIEVESTETIKDAGRQLRGYRGARLRGWIRRRSHAIGFGALRRHNDRSDGF